jgi:ferredoxin-nitrite reductase
VLSLGVIFPNVPDVKLSHMKEHPLLARFPLNGGALTAHTVSCTGAQFCGFGMITTKEKAVEVNKELEARLNIPNPVRIHWTGMHSCSVT